MQHGHQKLWDRQSHNATEETFYLKASAQPSCMEQRSPPTSPRAGEQLHRDVRDPGEAPREAPGATAHTHRPADAEHQFAQFCVPDAL